MKWIVHKAFSCLLVGFLILPCFASDLHIHMMSLAKAKTYKGDARELVYIRAKRFSNVGKAYQYGRSLQPKLAYPVSVLKRKHAYTVVVGPIKSAVNVRNAAMRIASVSTTRKPGRSHQHHVSRHQQIHATRVTKKAHAAPVLASHVVPHKKKIMVPAPVDRDALQDVRPSPHEQALAPPPPAVAKARQFNLFATMGAGLQYPQINSNTKINNGSGFPKPFDLDIYSFKNENHPMVALSGGYRFEQDNKWFPAYSIGASYQYLLSNNIGGTIMQFSTPSFTNYTYSWDISAHVLQLAGKANLFEYRHVLPYVNAGIGGASIRSNGYDEQPLPSVTPRTSAGFQDKVMIKIVYSLGFGVDYQINPQVIATLGYEYLNLGDISTGVGSGTWAGKSLYLGSYSTHQGLLSVTYLFDNNG